MARLAASSTSTTCPNGGVESDQLTIPPPEVMEALAVTKLSDPQRSVDVDQLVVARWRASTDIAQTFA
jgi:hypothetical protein